MFYILIIFLYMLNYPWRLWYQELDSDSKKTETIFFFISVKFISMRKFILFRFVVLIHTLNVIF